ncbi:hypothetical protein HD554DRAFT_2172537 [Boletus coccyginus]|nr:hypothetical protein HD554DRAFT_2172537 [Boletus coccyginus]
MPDAENAGRTLKRKRSPTPSDSELTASEGRSATTTKELVVEKSFCNFCGDHMGNKFNRCVDCGGYMCEQTRPDGPGCIWAGTLDRKKPFRCIVCEPRHWKKMEDPPKGDAGCLPYGFTGYGGRKRSKLTWPMVLATFTLATLPDKYVEKSLMLDFEMQYAAWPENLCSLRGSLKGTRGKKAAAMAAEGAEFVKRSVEFGVPANVFVVVDTHSDAQSGALKYAGRASSPQYSPASEVVREFVTPQLLAEMKSAAARARLSGKPATAASWYDDSPYSRGGWRGLLLSTCAPTMRVGDSFRGVRKLVEDDDFDFVIGFAGSSTLPTQVRNALSQVIERMGVDKTAGIWDTVMSVVGQDIHLLEVNSVVVVFKERGSSEVLARKIARHAPPMRPWGVEFRACATPQCDRTPFDFYVNNNNFDVRMRCRACGWVSAWVKERHWKEHVFRLDSTLPKVFWHSYPPSHALQNIFVEATREKERDDRRG